MNSNVASILIFLSVCGLVLSNPDRAVDCRKFVFAPLCRGVAAKRGALGGEQNGQPVYLTDESFRSMLRNLYSGIASLGQADDEYDRTRELTGKDEGESLSRMYQQNRYNPFLRFLSENGSNSEKDNFPAQEFDNL